MSPEILELLAQRVQPKQITDLCQRVKDLVKLSRDEMKKNYDRWDYFDQVYRGERVPDQQDKLARQRGEPEKLIIPLTFGQMQTFVAFGHSLYNQRDYFYEMEGSGAEDAKPAQIASALLEQNLTHNKFRATKLIQLLTDIGRFGLGITKETWVDEKCPVIQDVPVPQPAGAVRPDLAAPVNVPTQRQLTMQTKYMGNKLVNVSPYRWFPDVRLPLTRWAEGEFCADEIEESRSKLEQHERNGMIAGLEFVSPLPNESWGDRRLTFFKKGQTSTMQVGISRPEYYLVTEVQIRLNPSTTEISEGVMLDPAIDYDMVYVIWIANDDRIIRIDEAGYNHEEFGYNCAQFLDDQNRFINFSLCDIISACQDTATWFLNSHITSVRKTIFNQLAVDPTGVEIDDIIKRSPVIRLKPGRAGSGIDTWIKQLITTDVTQNHIGDVKSLMDMGKEATGINETLLGQFSSGRRSAKEAGNVANAAAARLVMIFASIWESCLAPQGQKMLSNLRQGLDVPTLVRVYGQINTQELTMPDLPGQPAPLYRLIPVSKADLVGNYDFTVFNGTLPSARAQTAGILKEILSEMMANPQVVAITQLDPQLLFNEILTLLNVRNVQRFKLTPERLQQIAQLAATGGNPGGPGNPQAGGGQPQNASNPANSQPRPGTPPR